MKTVIVGGVAGGASCAARLRRLKEKDEIVLLERGEFVSFANCGLPYHIGGEIPEENDLTLQTPESLRRRFRIDVRTGSEVTAVDTDRKAVTVRRVATGEEYTESYDTLVLAPGAAPIRPEIEGVEDARVFTLRSIPDTKKIKRFIEAADPHTAVVVGGGYIGCEMAENLKKAGLEVTIVERSDHLLPPLDLDMAAEVHAYLRRKGVRLALRRSLTGIRREKEALVAVLDRGEITADMVVLAIGVRPDTAFLAGSGIELTPRGSIVVDSGMQTSATDVFAAGDAVTVRNFITGEPDFLPLAGPANREGRVAADRIAGLSSEYCGTQGSSILRLFDMTAATTGLNEGAAARAGIDYDKTYTYSASHASYFPGATMMSLKLLWERSTHKIIGAQIVGFDGVDKRMDVIATALRLGAKVEELASLELCYAPPFGSAKDPVNIAGLVAENVITGKLRQFFWHDVAALPRDGSVTLLDTRTDAEVARGRIHGFLHIPLDSLRERIDELPKGKPVYVNCRSGFRSYLACRILAGYGFTAYNLAGGYRFYEVVMQELAEQS